MSFSVGWIGAYRAQRGRVGQMLTKMKRVFHLLPYLLVVQLVSCEQGSGLRDGRKSLRRKVEMVRTNSQSSQEFSTSWLSVEDEEYLRHFFHRALQSIDTSSPSPAPTPTPPPVTRAPSAEPEPDPTPSPTSDPTDGPTTLVTPEPTNLPVPSPTPEPTVLAPTALPTPATVEPEPTTKPVPPPTEPPTTSPVTAEPTDAPVRSPTDQPTTGPKPTNVPVASPTKTPTASPVVPEPEPTEPPSSSPASTNSTVSQAPTQASQLPPVPGPTNASPTPPVGPTMAPVSKPTLTPTMAPTLACDQDDDLRALLIRVLINSVSDSALVGTEGSPQNMAANWIINQDARRLCPNDPSLKRRYSLATFYFSTRGSRWSECSAPEYFNDTESIEEANLACNIQPFPDAGTDAWLTPSSECQWGGVYCDESGEVQLLDIGKVLLLLFIGSTVICHELTIL